MVTGHILRQGAPYVPPRIHRKRDKIRLNSQNKPLLNKDNKIILTNIKNRLKRAILKNRN